MTAFATPQIKSYIPPGYAYLLVPIHGIGCCKYDGIGIRFATRDFAVGYAMSLNLHSFKIIKEHPHRGLHRSIWHEDLKAWVIDASPARPRSNSI